MLRNGMLHGQEKEIVKYNIQEIAKNAVPWWDVRDAWDFIQRRATFLSSSPP